MSTIPCPGCGMPRAEELVGETACPVCGEAPPLAEDLEPEPEVLRPTARSTRAATDNLPADASELAGWAGGPRPGFRHPFGRLGAGLCVGFLLGATVGVGGVFAWQGSLPFTLADTADNSSPDPNTPAADPKPVDVAPMPREANHVAGYSPPNPVVSPADPRTPDPKPLVPPPPPGKTVVIDVNEPDGTYTLPFPTRNGEHVVLKGRAKVLKLGPVEGGAVVDASQVVAAEVNVGKVDGGATVKVNAPEGVVEFSGKVDGNSVAEINAPGGEVRFPVPTAGPQEGTKIDGGAKVTIVAKRVIIRGDIAGAATRVHVTLTRAGSLRASAVQNTAVLEYRSGTGGWSYTDVTVGPIAPTATVREVGPKPDPIDE